MKYPKFSTFPNRLIFMAEKIGQPPSAEIKPPQEILTNDEREAFNKLNYSQELPLNDRNQNRVQQFLLDAGTVGIEMNKEKFYHEAGGNIVRALHGKIMKRFSEGPPSKSVNAEIRRFQNWASQINPHPKIHLFIKNGIIGISLDIPEDKKYTVKDYGKDIIIPMGEFGKKYEIFNANTEAKNVGLVEKLRAKIRARKVTLKDIYPSGLDRQVQGFEGVQKLIFGKLPLELTGVIDRLRDNKDPQKRFDYSHLRERIGSNIPVRVQVEGHEIRLTYTKKGKQETLIFEDARGKALEAAKARREEFKARMKLKLKTITGGSKPEKLKAPQESAPKAEKSATPKKTPEKKDPTAEALKSRFAGIEKKYRQAHPDFNFRLSIGKGLDELNKDLYGIYAEATVGDKPLRYGSAYDPRLAQQLNPETIEDFFKNTLEAAYNELKSQRLQKTVRPELKVAMNNLKSRYPDKLKDVRYIAYTSSEAPSGKDAPHGFSIVIKKPNQQKEKLKIALGDYSSQTVEKWIKEKLNIA